MTRLSSYTAYFGVFSIAITGILGTIFAISADSAIYGYFIFIISFAIDFFLVSVSKRVYYQDSEIFLYNLFSNKCLVINKEKLVSIEKKAWWQSRGNGTYRINYVDDDNNSKHVDFEMSRTVDDPEELVDKLNSVD